MSAAYNHALHLKSRTKMMQDWADTSRGHREALRFCRFMPQLGKLDSQNEHTEDRGGCLLWLQQLIAAAEWNRHGNPCTLPGP